ncbi:hypothetical protein OsI_25281 [Oryza sativa Indica Group]|uniref:Uncharacterized protein n=1 Tax=Oryza sativa subsp. indica TaxID=39946 RepID=A2YJ72_ORYSI|nr:hypothetical protein OsI_25281 [Oryza sativa Indica Group]
MAAAPVGCAEGAPCVEQRGRLAVVKSGGTADEVGGSGWRVDDDDSGWGGWMARGGSPIRWRSSRPRWPRMAHPPAAPFARWTTADARHRQRRTDLPARRAAPGVVTIGGGNNGGGMVHGGGWGGDGTQPQRGEANGGAGERMDGVDGKAVAGVAAAASPPLPLPILPSRG